MNSKGSKVTITKERVKMVDIYPFTVGDLPELLSLVEMENGTFQWGIIPSGGNGLSFLPLVIDLLNDVDRIRKLKTSIKDEDYGVNLGINTAKRVSQCFLGIVKEWLEENNGKVNLLRITEVMRLNGHIEVAKLLERLLLRYSLPISAKDDEGRDNNVYSLSRGFLQEERNENGANGSKAAMDVNSSVERALQNSVILEEVFKKLQAREQKVFRLVTPVWKQETFSFWRKSVQLQIWVPETGQARPSEKNRLTMASYTNMVELDRKLQEGKRCKAKGSTYDLVKHPFRRYQLSYQDNGSEQKTTSFFSGPVENKFWRLCGPQIEDLQIEDATFDTIVYDKGVGKTCEMLLLYTCPNLKKLKISESCVKKAPRFGFARIIPENMRLGYCLGKTFAKKQNADKLHTLILEIEVKAEDLRNILFICPSLKSLVLHLNKEKLSGLLHPTSTGEYIKLENLAVHYSHDQSNTRKKFIPLRDYFELLANMEFNCLQHLSLFGINLSEARRSPFHLYAALTYCTRSLKSLNLNVVVNSGLQGGQEWFTDLSSFSFPNLTSLKLSIDFEARLLNTNMKFDFRTLEGMRMLEQLEIKVMSNDAVVGSAGTRDWIGEGNRTSYLPSGVDSALNLDTNPILCKNLKKFTFIGWGLNKEDIPLLSSWFPNLTQLVAEVKPDAVPYLLDNWSELEKIEFQTERLISLRELRPLKEKRKHLRVIQTISWSLGQTKRVELKEANGMIYFEE